jgi:hypothetical protein
MLLLSHPPVSTLPFPFPHPRQSSFPFTYPSPHTSVHSFLIHFGVRCIFAFPLVFTFPSRHFSFYYLPLFLFFTHPFFFFKYIFLFFLLTTFS